MLYQRLCETVAAFSCKIDNDSFIHSFMLNLSSPYRSALKFNMFLLNTFISFLNTDYRGLSKELSLQ